MIADPREPVRGAPAWWPLARLIARWALVWAVAAMFTSQCAKAYSLGNELSDIADSYSEANAIKAGENYAVHGFGSNAGLPDVSYGTQFDHSGGKFDKNLCADPARCVYLHYPEGPDLAVGAMTRLFGIGKTLQFRLFPLLVGLFGLGFLAWALTRTVGVVRAAVVLVALWYVPMASNMMHGLHYQGNAMSLLYVEVGVVLLALRAPRLKPAHVAGLALLGFLQGWISFDYCFLVALAPVPLWIAQPAWRSRTKVALALVVAAGAGFAFAHVLHFLQVARYMGGIGDAYHHMADTAAVRARGVAWPVLPIEGSRGVFIYYWFNLLPDKRYFDFSWGAFVAGTVMLLWPRPRFAVPLGGGALARASALRALAAFAASLVVCSLWIGLMRQHANIHGHFIPRHYCLAYLVGVLLVTETFGWRRGPLEPRSADRTERSEPTEPADAREPSVALTGPAGETAIG